MIYRNCSVSVWFYLSKKYFTKSLQLSFSTAVLNHAIRDSFLKNNHLKTFKLQTKSYWITAKSSSLHQTPHSKTESKFPTSWKCLSFISGNRSAIQIWRNESKSSLYYKYINTNKISTQRLLFKVYLLFFTR